MPAKKEIGMEWHAHKGKPLMIAGIVLLLIGALRFYNVDWPVVLMAIGAFLLAKGLVVKYKQK